MIDKIIIKNFRSIVNQQLDANWITTFVGENDAGKSNVLRALNLFFNGYTDPNEVFSPLRDFNRHAKAGKGKAKQIEVTLHIRLPESFQKDSQSDTVVWKKIWRENGIMSSMETREFADGSEIAGRSKIPTYLDRIRFSYVPAIKDKHFFNDLQGKLYDVLEAVEAESLRSSAAVFESKIGEHLEQLLRAIGAEFDGSSSMKMPENLRQIFESMELSSDGIPFSRRGDGIKIRHIPQMLKFVANSLNRSASGPGRIRYTHIWGFEEPENNVEMSACFKLANFFCDLIDEGEQHQLFLTTHSPIFYKIEDRSDDPEDAPWVTRYYLRKGDTATEFVRANANKVDEDMGLMPIVAPYVQDAKKRHDELQGELAKAKDIAANKKPTLFVEGKSDKIILSIAWKLFSSTPIEDIIIIDGDSDGDNGSANAVSSRALAWLLVMRHKDVRDRVKAFALFDNDDAGKDSRAKLKGDMEAISIKSVASHFKSELLEAPEELRPLLAAKFRLPIDLESYYSDDIWTLASKSRWLEKRPSSKILSPEMIEKMVSDLRDPFEDYSGVTRLRLTHGFKSNGKKNVVEHIAALSTSEKKAALAEFEKLIQRIETALL